MSLPFTSVVGYHMNPMTCGVAKFNAELSKRLGVPFVGLESDAFTSRPLLSLKASELDKDAAWKVQALCHALDAKGFECGFFWHDAGIANLSERAKHVFYADPSLGSPGLWCPSLLTPSKPRTVRLFSFGMAHKLQTAHYAKVRQLLEAAGLDYRLRVSVGLHEGTSLDSATRHFDALREIMGHDKVTILGCLSDDAVAEELSSAHVMLAFFEQGVRANNTTVHAALDVGLRVITNMDAGSPGFLYGSYDINAIHVWPFGQFPSVYTWENLIANMERVCEASASAIV